MNFLQGLGLSFASNAFQALGSWISGNQQKKENQKNRDFTERMYDKQVKNNIKMWNMQNEYDLPKNQIERLKMAGLNPDLMYSGVGVPPSPNLQTPSAGSPSTSPLTPYSIDPISKAKEYELMDAQIQNIKADSDKKHSETNLNLIDSITRGEFNNLEIKNKEALLNLTNEQQQLVKGQLAEINQNIETSKAAMDEIRSRIANLDADTIYKSLQNMFASDQFKAEIAKTWSEVQRNYADIYKSYNDVEIAYRQIAISQMLASSTVKLNDAQIEKLSNDSLKSFQEARNLSISSDRLQIQLDIDQTWPKGSNFPIAYLERKLNRDLISSKISDTNVHWFSQFIPLAK